MECIRCGTKEDVQIWETKVGSSHRSIYQPRCSKCWEWGWSVAYNQEMAQELYEEQRQRAEARESYEENARRLRRSETTP